MSYRIAVASTDGIYVDGHFGSSSSFLIFEVSDDGNYEIKEERIFSGNDSNVNNENYGCSSNSENSVESESNSESGCGFKSGCGSKLGCGAESSVGSVNNSGGGCGGGHSDTNLESKIALISDCRSLLCFKVGPKAERQLERKAITSFQVDLKVNDALKKIIDYYTKIDHHISLRNSIK